MLLTAVAGGRPGSPAFLRPPCTGPASRRPLERLPPLPLVSMPGVFAAGDVRHRPVKRVAPATGKGTAQPIELAVCRSFSSGWSAALVGLIGGRSSIVTRGRSAASWRY